MSLHSEFPQIQLVTKPFSRCWASTIGFGFVFANWERKEMRIGVFGRIKEVSDMAMIDNWMNNTKVGKCSIDSIPGKI